MFKFKRGRGREIIETNDYNMKISGEYTRREGSRDDRGFYRAYRISNKKFKSFGIILIIPLVLLTLRYGYICIFKGHSFKAICNSQYTYVENLEDIPYKIFDSNGEDFYQRIKKYTLVIDPIAYIKFNTDFEAKSIKTLKYILRNYKKEYLLPDEIQEGIDRKIYYVVDEETYNKLKEIENINYIKGVYIYESSNIGRKNNWDIVNLLTNPLDSRDGTKKSKDSLEGIIADKTKNNIIPKVSYEKDVTGRLMEPTYIEGENNINVKLTLDNELQNAIHEILQDEKYEQYDEVAVTLMEANTGKIRAMTQRDYSMPNVNIGAASNHGYFPGSIFKILLHEIGMETGVTWPNKIYERDKTIKEFNNKDKLTVREALIWSSNDIFYQIGEDIGFDNIYKIAKQHGMLEPVLGMHNEESGNFEVDKSNITRDQVRHSAIGQKIRITPLHALSIPTTVINGGKHVTPQIIESFVDNDKEDVEPYEIKEERIIKKSTASSLKENMIDIVNSSIGTAKNANVDGFTVGGKTGTSEYFEVDNEGNRVKHCDGWFSGFFTYKKIEYSMVVFVKDINCNSDYPEEGGTTAAPVFNRILKVIEEKNCLSLKNNLAP
ncbi:MAG: penicillin-binding transpeptidase domain-containing protein [Clostridium sp.]